MDGDERIARMAAGKDGWDLKMRKKLRSDKRPPAEQRTRAGRTRRDLTTAMTTTEAHPDQLVALQKSINSGSGWEFNTKSRMHRKLLMCRFKV